jgi:hypothetical protein
MRKANSRRRGAAAAAERRTVKISVPIATDTHARLCALASLSGRTHAAIVSELIEGHVKTILVIDRRKPGADRGSSEHEESAA